jgi:hypothetical protein
MGLLTAFFGKSNQATILAREVRINENPSVGESYIYIEGDQIGFLNWLLKLLGLKDPSIVFSISEDYVTRIEGKKSYSIIPTSEIHNINSGFSKNKNYLLLALGTAFSALTSLILAVEEGEFIPLFVLMALLTALFLWLYKRSGGLIVGVTTFNGLGEFVAVQSGMTGYKLEKDDFEKVFRSVKNAVRSNSKYYKS